MLTPKERLHRVLEGREADRAPCICPGGMMNMVTSDLMDLIDVHMPEAHSDPVKMAQLAEAVYKEGCFENCGVPFCMTVEAEAMGAGINMASQKYEPHVVEYVIDTAAEWNRLKPLDCGSGRPAAVLEAIRILKKEMKDVPIIGNLTGPVSTAGSVMEPVVFYKEMRRKNRDVHALMEFTTDQLIAFGREQIAAGADVIAISDPSGTGEILGPKYFREFTVAYLNRLLDGIATEKTGTIVHICGQMSPVYKEINEVRSQALSFDSIVPMKEARANLGSRVLMGNVSTYALEFGEPEKIRQLTENCLRSGSNIISPACGLGMTSPLRNVRAILSYVKEEA